MSDWILTPTSYTTPAGMKVAHKKPIDEAWKKAKAGDRCLLDPGTYQGSMDIAVSGRPYGSAPVEFAAINGGVIFSPNPVGGSDTFGMKSGVSDLVLSNITLQLDDRAGVKTVADKGARKVMLRNCQIVGAGPGPSDPLWKASGKWGEHHFMRGNWTHIDCVIEKVFDEHAEYDNTIAGYNIWLRTKVRHCGRTRIQQANRKTNYGVPFPVGYGNQTFIDEDVEDVCLEQNGGGSAYTFHGGCPTSTITLQGCKVRLGCAPTLAAPFNRSITGAVMVHSGKASQVGAGDEAHEGGTGRLVLPEPDIEVGTVWPGVGSAIRVNVDVSDCGEFLLQWGQGGRILSNGANKIALEIGPSVKRFAYTGQPAEWNGIVKYKGTPFNSWDLFAAAHPELRG